MKAWVLIVLLMILSVLLFFIDKSIKDEERQIDKNDTIYIVIVK